METDLVSIAQLERFPVRLNQRRHCEKRSDEAIQHGLAASQARLDCFASLAMTGQFDRNTL
jgi:hypothetical protein